MRNCPKCGKEVSKSVDSCPDCNVKIHKEENVKASNQQNVMTLEKAEEQFSMNWFWWVTNVVWIITAIYTLFTAFSLISGSVYGTYNGINISEGLYAMYGDIEFLDKAFGFIYILLVLYVIYTRFQLVKFKKRGPLLFVLTYLLISFIDMLYLLCGVLIAPDLYLDSPMPTSIITYFIANIIMAMLNMVYFKKRMSLFIN